ncbi:MAG TPA: MBL fold metallo-hydrolase [Chitinophagaceae bacterium]|nr:MBL fold metallo-hydrolase [Chitinophagaceae bacterium]
MKNNTIPLSLITLCFAGLCSCASPDTERKETVKASVNDSAISPKRDTRVGMDKYEAWYINDTSKPSDGSVKITFFGVSSLLLDDGETQLLIDGYFSRYPLELTQNSKIATDTNLVRNYLTNFNMNRVKGMFITHTHWDHAFDAAFVANKTKTKIYGSLSTLNVARGGGVPEKQLSLFQPGRKIYIGKFTVDVLTSKHSPSALVDKEQGRIITKPFAQPAVATDYVEGGSYDFLISHNGKKIYVKPSANWIKGKLDHVKSDVLFLGIATLGLQDSAWKATFYDQTVGKLKPALVIPLHWDNFFEPVSDTLTLLPPPMDDGIKGFDYMIGKTKADGIDFRILQGTGSIVLFSDKARKW